MGCLYLLTFPSGKQYVGITASTALDRFKEHCADSRRGLDRAVHRAIRKYGACNVIVNTLIKDCSWNALQALERGLIQALKTFGNGYNMTEGGDGALGYRHDESSLKKMGETHRGNTYRKGKTFSHATREQMSKAKLGKSLSSSHRANIAKALIGNTYSKGCVRSEEFRAAMVKANRGIPKPEAKVGIAGVSIDSQTGKYRATITVKCKTIHLGRHKTLEEAVAARKRGEEIYFNQEAAR